jgi:hypothetical protein
MIGVIGMIEMIVIIVMIVNVNVSVDVNDIFLIFRCHHFECDQYPIEWIDILTS